MRKCKNCIIACFRKSDKDYKGLVRENFIHSKEFSKAKYLNSLCLAYSFIFCPKCGRKIDWDEVGDKIDKKIREKSE